MQRGERVGVELWTGGRRVAHATEGGLVELRTTEGDVVLDVSHLDLSELPARVHRGSWSELSSLPAARLVIGSSPSPATRAELHVRRLQEGTEIELEITDVEHTFDEDGGNRNAPRRRVGRASAVRLGAAPSASGPPPRRWGLRAAQLAFGILLVMTVLATAFGANFASLLIGGTQVLALLAAYRLLVRALDNPPLLDDRIAHPFVRAFARGARSLPRFAPSARDGSRQAARWLGGAGAVAWGYLVFVPTVWSGAILLGHLSAERLSPTGSAGLLAGEAAALLVLSAAYWLCDISAVPQARALLSSLDAAEEWRSFLGLVEPGDSPSPLSRKVFLESDSADSEDNRFYASHEEKRAPSLRVSRAGGPTLDLPLATALWASSDVVEDTPSTAEMRVQAGSSVLVGTFFIDDGPSLRGPGSVVLFASLGRPDDELRRGLSRRRQDAALSVALGLFTIAAALGALFAI